MKLSQQDVELFFKLMFSLQNFVNVRMKIVRKSRSLDAFLNLRTKKKAKIRKALYEHPNLIDEYVKENPQGFKNDELEIVRNWKNFHKGTYFIERLLKKYAVFIEENKVYAVLALNNSFYELVPYTPFYVRTVLLPFKGKIVYDGFLEPLNVNFGANIRRELKKIYLTAKKQGRIIVNFDMKAQMEQLTNENRQQWQSILNDLASKAATIHINNGDNTLYSLAFSAVNKSIEFARMTVKNPNDTKKLEEALDRLFKTLEKADDILYKNEFYNEDRT